MGSLTKEFDALQERTAGIRWCQQLWWEQGALTISDWILADAWFRSRCLELPQTGPALVPCLDMVNHASGDEATAYYDQNTDGDVQLLLRPGTRISTGGEITISYGDAKSAAEMIFSYGFLDKNVTTTTSLTLHLDPLPYDPLGRAKAMAFTDAATVRFYKENGLIKWESSFVYLMCVNEEDGLDFKVLRELDSDRSPLRVFWQEQDVTDETDQFERLIEPHPMRDIFHLRAAVLLQDLVVQRGEELVAHDNETDVDNDDNAQALTQRLRRLEQTLLEAAYDSLENMVSLGRKRCVSRTVVC